MEGEKGTKRDRRPAGGGVYQKRERECVCMMSRVRASSYQSSLLALRQATDHRPFHDGDPLVLMRIPAVREQAAFGTSLHRCSGAILVLADTKTLDGALELSCQTHAGRRMIGRRRWYGWCTNLVPTKVYRPSSCPDMGIINLRKVTDIKTGLQTVHNSAHVRVDCRHFHPFRSCIEVKQPRIAAELSHFATTPPAGQGRGWP